MVDIAGQVPGCLYGNIRVVTQYFHTQVCSRVGHLYADSSKTDDTQLLALNFMACELLLLLFRKLTDILIHALGLYPVHSADDISGCQQHTCQYQLFYTVGIGARRIEDHDTFFAALVNRDVVDASARPGNRRERGGHFHVVHGGGTHHDAVGGSYRIPNRVFRRIKAVEAAGSNFIQSQYIHNASFFLSV